MPDQIIPDTNEVDVAILAVAIYYAEKWYKYYGLSADITSVEWKKAFLEGATLAKESLKDVPF